MVFSIVLSRQPSPALLFFKLIEVETKFPFANSISRNLVLVVDDDRGILRSMKRLLRQHGYDTLLFPSADAFKNHNDFENVVCIILDINLNDGSGIALRHRLKAAGISVPVIYITANDNT